MLTTKHFTCPCFFVNLPLVFVFVFVFHFFFPPASKVLKVFCSVNFRYQKSKSLINQLFGPKAHRRFPREYRLAGGGCTADGFYPTDTDGYYDDQGVDLVISDGSEVRLHFW